MLDILLNNYLLIINIVIPFAFGLFFVITNKEYSLKEFGIQVSLTSLILILAFWAGYGVNDVYTKSYTNTNVKKIVFEEEWTERVTYTESYTCGKSTCYRTKTRYDNHPDRYYIGSGDHGGDYANFLERLGLHFQTDAGWWNKTAVDKDNIFAFIMYQLGEDEDESMNSDIDFVMDLLNKIPKKYLRLNDNHVNIYHLIKEYRSR